MTLQDASEIVFLDFEYQSDPGERPVPICYVARELRSGRLFRQWVEDERPAEPPFAHGPNEILVAFFNSAELGCYCALGWPFPSLTIDLFAEFRARTNGLGVTNSLVGALRFFGLNAMDASFKDLMRTRILAGGPYSSEERKAILNYCQGDVDPLPSLLARLFEPNDNITSALWRGAYMAAIAQMEWFGIPVDAERYRSMVDHWPEVQLRAIARVNESIPVYEENHFRAARFAEWLQGHGLYERWPRTTDGSLALDDDTFKEQAALHPELARLRQTRQLLGQLHRPGLTVGHDGRARCMMSPLATVTGRNAPSTTRFIFGCPSWMRGLIRPENNTALAYCDWSAQEFGIASALSGDPNMRAAYESGDCYLAFARLAKAVPEDATKATHPRERQLFKSTVLGTQYLISAPGLAYQLDITQNEAENLLDHHHRVFSQFWKWSESVSDCGQILGGLIAAFGWRMQVGTSTRLRTLRKFPMQANASEMLRLAVVLANSAGVRVIGSVHDALVVEAPVDDIQHAAEQTQSVMRKASEAVLAGFSLRTDATIIRPPGRFEDERGREMWDWMSATLATL